MVSDKKSTPVKSWPLELLKTLDICQEIHIYAEEIYLHLSALHHEDREISRIFGELAVDKCNLSDAFKMASRLKGSGLSRICITPEAATELLDKMKTLLQWINSNPVSAVHALRFAIRMEESLEKIHILNAVTFDHDQDRELMTANLKKSSGNLHLMTEEYLNLTLSGQYTDDAFAD